MRIEFTTWSEQGIPYAETRARLSERGDDECRAAGLILLPWLVPESISYLFTLANEASSTVEVLNACEGRTRIVLKEAHPDYSAREVEQCLEYMGLIIEGWRREAGGE